MIYYHPFQLVTSGTTLFGGVPIWKVALAIHISCWILQFIGHGVFEGNEVKCSDRNPI